MPALVSYCPFTSTHCAMRRLRNDCCMVVPECLQVCGHASESVWASRCRHCGTRREANLIASSVGQHAEVAAGEGGISLGQAQVLCLLHIKAQPHLRMCQSIGTPVPVCCTSLLQSRQGELEHGATVRKALS